MDESATRRIKKIINKYINKYKREKPNNARGLDKT
jgi:hypothetical protein